MAPKRKAISKGLRFEIFKRDGFTCQYCGEQPPGAILHIDHILPVVEGGTNDDTNLITSCAACNMGKGRKILNGPPRPDIDLVLLEKQQEIAELRQYQEVSAARRALIGDVVDSLQKLWFEMTGQDYGLDRETVRRMVAKFGPALVEDGIAAVAIKVAGGYVNRYNGGWEKYLWGTLQHMADGT